jgi:WD40 repeat protein
MDGKQQENYIMFYHSLCFICSYRDALEKPDVNSMLYCKADGHIYAGCGDNKIYIFSLEDGKLVRTMEGHDDYIHSIHNV